MTYLVERLTELRRHLDHLREIRPRVTGAESLIRDLEFSPTLVEELARLPGFRNILVHEYVALDYGLVIRALDEFEPIEEFVRSAAELIARGAE